MCVCVCVFGEVEGESTMKKQNAPLDLDDLFGMSTPVPSNAGGQQATQTGAATGGTQDILD